MLETRWQPRGGRRVGRGGKGGRGEGAIELLSGWPALHKIQIQTLRYTLMVLPADTSADVSETILFGTSWATSQLRGKSRAGSEGRVQTRRGKGESNFPGRGR